MVSGQATWTRRPPCGGARAGAPPHSSLSMLPSTHRDGEGRGEVWELVEGMLAPRRTGTLPTAARMAADGRESP
eukprot:scaffold190063_cov31-Tisochrysis_lutea.AAC.1